MSGCQKRAYASAAEANEDARRIQKTPKTSMARGGSGRKTRPYLCPLCGLFHLTSQSKVEARRFDRKKGRR